VLDGGHLLFFSFEAVRGRPLAIRHREMAQQVGLFLLLALMVFVFYNDITRIVTG
jgi:regulator of sigma E protease